MNSDLCKTCYPLLMVHGVGFRDLRYFNYCCIIISGTQKIYMDAMEEGLLNSTTMIARDTGLVACTIWLCRQKVCNVIKDMYGYNDLFSGVGEADKYYCRAATAINKISGFILDDVLVATEE